MRRGMSPCGCSVSSLHVHGAQPCCPSSQVRLLRGVNLPERIGGISESVVVTLRSASKIKNVDSRGNLIKTFSLDRVDAGLRSRKSHGRQSVFSVGLKDSSSKAGPRRKPVSEIQYRVQDAVDSGAASIENGADDAKGRYRDRNRKQRNGERRRKVQILGSNGVVDLEEHLGLVSKEEEYRGEDTTATMRRVAATPDEDGRRLLESTLLGNNVSDLQRRAHRSVVTSNEANFETRLGGQALKSERSDFYSGSTEVVTDFPEDVIEVEVEVAEESPTASVGFDNDGQNELGKSELETPRPLAELPGGRRVVELVAAWDGLAGRLPPEFSRSSGSDLLLRALKLTVIAFQRTSSDDGGRTPLTRALAIAHTLVDLGMDAEVISTGLLREAVDSGLVSYDIVEQSLDGNIARLLRDCSRVRHIPSRVETLDDDSAAALRQFCLAFHDIRSVVVELASQLHVMQHIQSIPRYRQQILALETMQIYAPLAHAIGTGAMALELEDLGFRVLFPDSYSYIETWLRSHWEDGSSVVDGLKEQLAARLEEDSELQTLVSSVIVSGRYKSRFSTMRKLLKDGRKPEEVYDVLGLRVILEPKADNDTSKQGELGIRACYRAMEIATSMWQEVPGRLKDYIANRKDNGYESLHLAVYVSDENSRPPMEIQIRTVEMDNAAVSGEASHSLYKGGMTDPEQIRNLKLIMVAAANAAASRFGEIAGTAMGLEGGNYSYDDKDEMFKMFDKNQDGVISVEEFREVITELGADEGDALELMQIVDLNTDGSVSAEEFGKFRHQIQICQNLAGVDKEYRSQLGSKLQGDGESPRGMLSLLSGKESEKVAGLISQEVEDSLGSSACIGALPSQSSSSPPVTSLPEEVYDHGSMGSLKILDVDTSKRRKSIPQEDREVKMSKVEEVPTSSKVAGSGNSIPLKGKPHTNALKSGGPSPRILNYPELEPKLEDDISTVKAAVLGELSKNSSESKNIASKDGIEYELSNIRKQAAAGNLIAACGLAAQFSKQHPSSTKALLYHGGLERKCGNLQSARTLYTQAIELFQFKKDLGVEYVRALQAWASLEVQAGKEQKARRLFAECIAASEKGDMESSLRRAGVYGLHGWAMLEERSGNWAKARNLLERAADLQPGNAVVHQSRASLEARAHNYSAARIHFTRAVKAAPNDVKCWHAWAKFEATRRNIAKMRNLFQRALQVDPKNLHSLQAWAHHEGRIGTFESRAQARKLYRECVDVDPNNEHSWQAWGILEGESENYDGARLLFKRCLETNEDSVPCLQAFAHMERKCGNLEVARKLLQRALAVEPDNAPALMELALVEDMSGNSETALELYKFAESLDKQKSLIKRRMFRSRKRELQASGAIKPKAPSRPRIRKSRKQNVADDSSSTEDSSVVESEKQQEDMYSVVTTGSSDR
ncbi:unnamed protein product [Calypogeia fissa]